MWTITRKSALICLGLLLIGASMGRTQNWTMLHQSRTFLPKHLFFLNEMSGWVTGDSAVVYRTMDGGSSWELIHPANSGMPDQRDIFFVNDTLGFMVGETGSVFKTNNGGKDWQSIQDPAIIPAKTLESVFFVNDSVGFVCGRDSIVCKTTDGGITWSRLAIPLGNSQEDLADIAFFDVNHGICISEGNTGTVLVTADGGASWEKVDISGLMPQGTVSKKLYDLDLYGNRYALITGYHRVTFFSSDTGRTWQRVGPYTLDFAYNDQCLIVNEEVMFSGGQDGFLVVTTDGWATWDTLYTGSAVDLSGLYFSDSQNGIVLQTKYLTAAHLYRTSDGGDTWHPALEWPNITFSKVSTSPLKELVAVSSDGGEWTVSSDLGNSWSYPNNLATRASGGLLNLFFLNSNRVVLTGEGGYIALSEDGGSHFSSVQTRATGSTSKMLSVTGWGADSIWVGSSKGEIFWSFDGGSTWIDTLDVGSEYIYGLHAFDAQHVIACASRGTILLSADGGVTWIKNVITSSRRFYDMVFVDSDTGFFVSDRGVVWRTKDGGSTVSPVDTLDCGTSYDRLYGIAASPGGLMAIVGEKGSAFYSLDHGKTWVDAKSPVDVDLNSVVWLEDAFWAVGERGTILKLEIPLPSVRAQDRLLAQNQGLPTKFQLKQNYPNPFNPSTEIRFDLPKGSRVELTVFNALGQKVVTLLNAELKAGSHAVIWDGCDRYGVKLSSGLYVYALSAPSYRAVRKMVLLR